MREQQNEVYHDVDRQQTTITHRQQTTDIMHIQSLQ